MGTRSYLLLALIFVGCGNSGQPAPGGSGERPGPTEPAGHALPVAAADAAPPAPVELTLAELGLDGIDPAADPCADFYRYACGRWKAPVASRLEQTRGANDAVLAEALAADQGAAGQLFRQCRAGDARLGAGMAAAQPLLDAARAVKSSADIGKALGTLHRHRVWAGFSVAAAPDFADGRRVVLHIDAGGLTLGDRDYYLEAKDAPDRGEDFVKLRRSYEDAIANLVETAGGSAADGKRMARDVVRFEAQLAALVRSRYERRAPAMLADRVDRKALAKLADHIDWKAYFAALGAGDVDQLNLTDRRGLERLDRLAQTMSASSWQHYLEWHVLYALAPYGPPGVADARRAIDALVGAESAPSRPCVAAARAAYPDLTGELLAARRLPDDRRDRVIALVSAMARVHAEAVRAVGWLTADTRKRAGDKVEAIDVVVGVPDWLRGGKAITGKSYLATIVGARSRETARQLATLGTEAGIGFDASAPGARYEWLGNRLVLAPGAHGVDHVRADRPVAAALGALATTAGYGVALAADDRGGRWSERGALASWWTEADIQGFRESSQCLLDRAAKAKHIDGPAVLARARAERAGIEAGYRVYKDQPVEARVKLKGANRDQLYFLAAASAMCGAAPGARWRVNRAMADIPAFAEIFQCKPGAPLNPTDRCR